MAFRIDDPEALRLIKELVGYTGETEEEAVENALREKFDRLLQERRIEPFSKDPNPS
jgi:hypothetical protein